MENLIKINGAYGAKVGNQTVFTKAQAIKVYNAFIDSCYNDLSYESTYVLDKVSEDMTKLGFTWDELEKIETKYLQSLTY